MFALCTVIVASALSSFIEPSFVMDRDLLDDRAMRMKPKGHSAPRALQLEPGLDRLQ
jgi:hypothetical protein